jgi:glycosyltransferase involved in cell wall biosynthesis
MRILIAHNAYQQKGGEDSVMATESTLLSSRGVEVAVYSRHNDEITGMSRVALAGQTIWSSRTEADIAKWVADFRPDVIHVHNTLPLISPSLYVAAHKAGVPVVQTLHNFRLFCTQAMFLRDGKVCEDCLGKLPWRGVVHGCYRNSRVQSAVVGGMLAVHRALGTYRNKVTRYIALNEFCRKKFIEGGLPAERIVVKPNFVDIPAGDEKLRQGGLFVGRLSAEKGIVALARAMDQVPTCQLNVIGSGPEEAALSSRANIHMLGFLPRDQIFRHMQRAAYLLMPSIWYENFPLTLVEAFACGLPVIASRMGAMAELIEDGRTGLLFEPGAAEDLAKKIIWAEANPEAMIAMGKYARNEYEAKYTPERNFRRLMVIYMEAINARKNLVSQG